MEPRSTFNRSSRDFPTCRSLAWRAVCRPEATSSTPIATSWPTRSAGGRRCEGRNVKHEDMKHDECFSCFMSSCFTLHVSSGDVAGGVVFLFAVFRIGRRLNGRGLVTLALLRTAPAPHVRTHSLSRPAFFRVEARPARRNLRQLVIGQRLLTVLFDLLIHGISSPVWTACRRALRRAVQRRGARRRPLAETDSASPLPPATPT